MSLSTGEHGELDRSGAVPGANANGGGESRRDALRPWLSIWNINAPAKVRRERLPFSGEALIGRLEACDITIDDPFVSNKHLVIRVSGGRADFWDQKSRNGTLVNQRTCLSGELNDGDVLRIGDTCVQVHYPRAGTPTQVRTAEPHNRLVAVKFDGVRAAVVTIYTRFDGELLRFRRGHLDALLGEMLGNKSERQGRRALDEFAKHLGVPDSVQRSARWQMVGDICAGRRPQRSSHDG